MADWKDIFSGEEEQLSEEELMKYLNNTLSEEEKNAVERKLSASDFESDAVDGLQEFNNTDKLNQYISQLNKNLHENLKHKKQRKEKRKIKDMPLAVLSVILILVLVLVAFVVIEFYQHVNKQNALPGTPRQEQLQKDQ